MRHSVRLAATSVFVAAASSIVASSPAAAQEAAEKTPGLMSPNPGLMIWTLLIFALLFIVLRRYAFPSILGAVEARERALEEAVEGAKRDREAAAQLLAQQQAALDATRQEAQQLLAQAHAAAERARSDSLEQTRVQQDELLARARREIDADRLRAIADLRREAVDLALAGATKVIGRNLDDAGNRRLVEDFLSTIPAPASLAAADGAAVAPGGVAGGAQGGR
ncbi:MAG TPA: F0F1 ATP synthase subunit B [Gemmatirosa sp.]